MRAEPAKPDIAKLLKPLSTADIFVRPASAVVRGALRLEAGFYGSEGYRALQAMKKSGFDVQEVGDVASVRWLGPFSRTYVEEPGAGVPFLTSSTMLNVSNVPEKYISKALTRDLERLLVFEGTILISCSGTIGNVAICTDDFSGYAVSQDAIRVDPRNEFDRGFLYAFLLSEVGRFLVTRNKSGSVVEHLYAADIEGLPVPGLPKSMKAKLTENVKRACDLRVEANRGLEMAQDELKGVTGVDDTFKIPPSLLEVISSRRADLCTEYEGLPRFRLDATFQGLLARRSIAHVKKCDRWDALGKSVQSIPFTGPGSMPDVPKVDSEEGVPCVTARDLCLARPRASYFVTKRNPVVQKKMIPTRGTTLVMCAGTLGATEYVRRNYEEWAVSLDVIRVVPDPAKLHPGYVYAYLSSNDGQAQALRHKYGSVIPRIHSRQVAEILIPIPEDRGERIGTVIDEAFDKRAEAVSLEDDAIRLFMSAIERGRSAVEDEWGREY